LKGLAFSLQTWYLTCCLGKNHIEEVIVLWKQRSITRLGIRIPDDLAPAGYDCQKKDIFQRAYISDSPGKERKK
jgi:hypothetical protein